ncbi:MAG: sigma-70 family RNA polymerase sigma factor [Bacteroidota bacterium]
MPENICPEKTFRTIFQEQATALRNFLYYKTGNLPQAEDVLQDAFGKLWENCAKIIPTKAKSFLFTTANNLLLNQIAHQKVVLKFQSRTAPKTSRVDPQFLLEEKEFHQKLAAAIGALPEKQRVVFLMNRIDKKKYREIADILDISVKTVEKRMHQALTTLRKIYQKI